MDMNVRSKKIFFISHRNYFCVRLNTYMLSCERIILHTETQKSYDEC